jgi:hypothetical protein
MTKFEFKVVSDAVRGKKLVVKKKPVRNPIAVWRSKRGLAKKFNWLLRYARWIFVGSPEPEVCSCCDPWMCGRPHYVHRTDYQEDLW